MNKRIFIFFAGLLLFAACGEKEDTIHISGKNGKWTKISYNGSVGEGCGPDVPIYSFSSDITAWVDSDCESGSKGNWHINENKNVSSPDNA